MSIASRYRDWLSNFPKEPKERLAIALGAIDAFESCQSKKDIATSDLEPLVAAGSSPYKLLCETGCNLLCKLATTNRQAQECLLRMAQSKSMIARLHAVAYLHANLPEVLRVEILGLGIRDRSAKVRGMAVDRVGQFNFLSFLPQLEEMQKAETEEFVLRQLAFNIPLLRDGYLLEPYADGSGYSLIVRSRWSTGGPFIPKEKCTPEFVQQEMRRYVEEQEKLFGTSAKFIIERENG
jgi:hypothetical protein